MNRTLLPLLGLCALTLSFSGCATSGQREGDQNTSRAQFLDDVWVTPSMKGKTPSDLYQEVMFRHVKTGQLRQMGWWAAQSPKTQADLEHDAVQLGGYMQRSFEQAVANYPNGHFRVVHTPGPSTVVIDLSIKELVPAKKYWNAAATGAGFVIPGAGLLGAAGKGSVTIDGQVYDGSTGNIIAGFTTHETDDTALINTAQFSWYRGSQKSIDDVAQKTAAFLNAPAGTVIKKSSNFKVISN
jgi:hypothetical protein